MAGASGRSRVVTSALCILARRRLAPTGRHAHAGSRDTVVEPRRHRAWPRNRLVGRRRPSPHSADLFWLAFYPVVYVALVLLLRKHVGRGERRHGSTVRWPVWVRRRCAPASRSTPSCTRSVAMRRPSRPISRIRSVSVLLMLAVGGTAIIPGKKNHAVAADCVRHRLHRDRRHVQSVRQRGLDLARRCDPQRDRVADRNPAHLGGRLGAAPPNEPAGAAERQPGFSSRASALVPASPFCWSTPCTRSRQSQSGLPRQR